MLGFLIMATVKQILELKKILTNDSEKRQGAIEILFNALRLGFTSKTIGAIQPLSSEMSSIASAISRARVNIKALAIDEKMFNFAVEILEQEYEYITQIYDEYFVKAFAKEIDIDWVRKNIQVDKLKTLAIELNEIKIREKTLLENIDRALLDITKQKRQSLQRFG